MILISSIPVDRAGHSIDALKAGKDVMVDKPGCTTLDQLNNLKNTVKETKKLFKKITKDIIITNFIEAELSKIFSNLYRYINFAIPNEMYLISKKLNANFTKIREIMSLTTLETTV